MGNEFDVMDDTLPGEESNVPATRSMNAIARPGEVHLDLSGLLPPFLSLVHGVGTLSENFSQGDLVLFTEHKIVGKGEPLGVIILNVEQYYRERLTKAQWDAKQVPRSFADAKEASDAGLRMAWDGDQGPEASMALDLVLLLKKPKDLVCGLFSIDIGDGEEYAICKLSTDKKVAQVLLQDIGQIVTNKLRNTGVYSASWVFQTELTKPNRNNNRTLVIRAKFTGMLDPTLVSGIESALLANVPVDEYDED